MDAGSGRVLYGKNADRKLPMASTTKIMTCILVLELADPEASFGVSAYAQSMPKVKLNVKKGEQYTVKDLLYSLMLESHNDSAVVLAEGVGKQFLGKEAAEKPTEQFTREESKQAVAAFAKRMNDKALELGCKDTLFITPNGLDASEEVILEDGTKVQTGHGTTAKELARIMAYCIGESCMKEEFLKITRTPSHSFYANGRSFCCVNHNSFLQMMDGAQSGKTGFMSAPSNGTEKHSSWLCSPAVGRTTSPGNGQIRENSCNTVWTGMSFTAFRRIRRRFPRAYCSRFRSCTPGAIGSGNRSFCGLELPRRTRQA